MRLLNMDVDRFGDYGRNSLGPFSSGLNAICGPRGAGKSTLLSWLRAIAMEDRSQVIDVERHRIAGIAELESRGRQYRVTTDRNGRMRVDATVEHGRDSYAGFAAESSRYMSSEAVTGRIFSEIQRNAFAGLAAASTAAQPQVALQDLALRLGVSQVLDDSPRDVLIERRRHIEASLQSLVDLTVNRETLLARQGRLEEELKRARSSGHILRYEGQDIEHRRLDQRSLAIEADLQAAMQEVARLDAEIAAKQAELRQLESDPATVAVGESYRKQLQQIDDRLNRWRQTLRDLRSHRQNIEHNTTDARLDKQIGDQLSTSKEADPRAALRSLEAQIASTRQQLDLLVQRYTDIPGYDYRSASAAVSGTGYRPNEVPHSHGVFRDATGKTYVGHPHYLPETSALPETLRSMQKDLHEVCQQLARHESQTATETLRQQSSKLQRCESELLECIEELIEERANLLRRIASEHHLSVEQLTLAFGNWCQCHDHPHLKDWLLSEEGNAATQCHGDAASRQHLLDELYALKQTRKEFSVRADECRRQLRDADTHRRGTVSRKAEPTMTRSESEIQHDLQRVLADLAALAERERLQSELRDIDRKLAETRDHSSPNAGFDYSTRRHIAGLMGVDSFGNRYQVLPTEPRRSAVDYSSGTSVRYYDLVDGEVSRPRTDLAQTVAESRREVPQEVICLAMRLAIADALAARGEPISLWIDESLDLLPRDLQNSCISYLAHHPSRSQQIVVLTADQRIADAIRAEHGWVGYLRQQSAAESSTVNQQLAALANDEEADKWYRTPMAKPEFRGARNEFYLHEGSLIEDLPSIDPDLAARCRSFGVDRIGDLLRVDPYWLADSLRVDGISNRTVEAWQAVASLLCSVRNLRPFDARVLVGAGVRGPKQLSQMHPSQLLDRVERFLATERGRRILRSGTSYELSRITTWIASATNGTSRRYDWDTSYDRDVRADARYGRRQRTANGSVSRRSRRKSRSYPVISRSGDRMHTGRTNQDRFEPRTSSEDSYQVSSRKTEAAAEDSSRGLKFYLELSSPVVDAPSIGPRMAERLEQHNIHTVDQLLAIDPEFLADKLDLRRVTAEIVTAWQDQARLVCRIPNLRGHDAQLLVACELTAPEDIAAMDTDTVYAQVSEIAESKQGQRILRGSDAPDRKEVADWISWAAQSRKLSAA